MSTIIFILIYLIFTFIFGTLYYLYQEKIKKFVQEDVRFEETPEESFLIGLLWPVLIPGILLMRIIKNYGDFLEKFKSKKENEKEDKINNCNYIDH